MFNSGLTGLRLWHLVQLLRLIDGAIDALKVQYGATKKKNLLTHGNRFIAHKVMHGVGVSRAGQPNFGLANIKELGVMVEQVTNALERAVENEFSDSYLASLFKNATKCRTLADEVAVPSLVAD